MFHCHLQNICLFQLGLLLRDGFWCETGSVCWHVEVRHVAGYSHPAWTLRSQFPSADPDSCLFSPGVSSRWVVSSSVREKIIKMVKRRGGGGRRRLRAEAWSKRIARSYPKLNYLSLFFSTGVFSWVVRHIWSSHVSSRFSVRFYVLFSGSRRAFRALGAARPRYLSAAISMWILQLFGCGIFPHTGSYPSRLTGHCLHSITQGPSPEKKKKRNAGDRCPAWHQAAHHSTQFPLLPGMRST